ncbi:unnamed protein product [Cercopithifilaria johnstoni]|uniref:C2 domain-containing protein n=1 Tax=Cercopithifilaria johnstoni TaxID=2874296 RepID=A0A8J2LRK9_9BILA|nr:unnamed protein product [Cercopithifilaria johnstoni]
MLLLLFFVVWLPTIHVVRMLTSASTIRQRDPEEFWISANLLNVEWKLDCLTITYCNQPELKMIKRNLVNGEKSSFSWQLDQNFEQLSNSAFISHWTKGSPMDIEMSIEIIGIDPKYRFQRSCDQSVATEAFKYEVQEEHFGSSSAGNSSDLDQMIVELLGRCFNVTLTVQKHIKRCPWCTKIKTTAIATATMSYENGFPIKQYSWLVITCIITSCLTIICAVQCILNLYWKSGKLSTRKASTLPVVQSKSWKIMKIHGNDHLIRNTMSKSKNSSSNSSRTIFKNKSLINGTNGQFFANSDTIIDSNRSSSVSVGTYDNIGFPDDIYRYDL